MHTMLDYVFVNPIAYFTIVAVVIVSIVLHELGHALTATWEGDPTPKIRGHLTWNPVVHMGWISLILVAVMGIGWGRTPVTPSNFRHRRWGAVLVSFAGPSVNLMLAFLGATVLALASRGVVTADRLTTSFWNMMLYYNVVLFLLNMLPLPPLDGFAVADGAFDLGDLGAWLKSMGMLPFIVAILIVNSQPFDVVTGGVADAIYLVAQRCVGA